jgi:hypothetical protein
MADYELTITRREPNPQYVPAPAPDPYYPHRERDERTPEQRSVYIERVLSVTLTDAEYEVVKQAVITHWCPTTDGAA